jgi:uncharacterized membrane protein YagU involved in acid resistance
LTLDQCCEEDDHRRSNPVLLRALLAALLGTVAMTLSSTTEMRWRERAASLVPAQAALKILGPVWKPDLKERGMQILGNWTHWAYGTWWGVVFWLLIDAAGLSLAATAVAFFFIVWLTEQVELPLVGLTPPSWKWGLKENLIDVWHHVVYVAGTVMGWVLIGLAA